MPLIVLSDAAGDAATNMAIDATLLESTPENTAVFRHYGWTESAATFGYTQKQREVASLFSNDLRLCRRITGGGVVDHRNDWTYALVIKAPLTASRIKATDLYRQIHFGLAQALEKTGVPAKLAPCPYPTATERRGSNIPDQCFLSPSAHDVLTANGIKVAGAAMKRTRQGVLVQGSMDRGVLPEDFDYSAFARKFTERLAGTLAIAIEQNLEISSICERNLIESAREQFRSDQWNGRR